MLHLVKALCAFGEHDWKLVHEGIAYNFFECRRCPDERMEPK